jgi:hypothetical protein
LQFSVIFNCYATFSAFCWQIINKDCVFAHRTNIEKALSRRRDSGGLENSAIWPTDQPNALVLIPKRQSRASFVFIYALLGLASDLSGTHFRGHICGYDSQQRAQIVGIDCRTFGGKRHLHRETMFLVQPTTKVFFNHA